MIWWLVWLIATELIFFAMAIWIRDKSLHIEQFLVTKVWSTALGGLLTGILYSVEQSKGDRSWSDLIIDFTTWMAIAIGILICLFVFFYINWFIFKWVAIDLPPKHIKRRPTRSRRIKR